MAKIEIQFTEDYATSKKGDVAKYDGMLASTLIRKKVAKLYVKEAPAPKPKAKSKGK